MSSDSPGQLARRTLEEAGLRESWPCCAFYMSARFSHNRISCPAGFGTVVTRGRSDPYVPLAGAQVFATPGDAIFPETPASVYPFGLEGTAAVKSPLRASASSCGPWRWASWCRCEPWRLWSRGSGPARIRELR